MKNLLLRLVRPDDLQAVWKTFLISYRDMVRIDTHALSMSSKEFGAMENYIISGPALF